MIASTKLVLVGTLTNIVGFQIHGHFSCKQGVPTIENPGTNSEKIAYHDIRI